MCRPFMSALLILFSIGVMAQEQEKEKQDEVQQKYIIQFDQDDDSASEEKQAAQLKPAQPKPNPSIVAEKAFFVQGTAEEILEERAGVGERYALLIGITEYANPSINLNFAAKDAQAMRDVLIDSEIGAYKEENVRLLVNEEATRKNIVSALNSWLGNRVQEEDTVLVFYSGHGALGGGTDAYWVTYDSDVDDLYSSALSNQEISILIGRLPARRKITLIDSCYSEATAKKYRALVPNDVFRDFKGEGVVTITASTGQEKSVEVGGNGAFTYHLLDALAGQGDSNGNGVVELDEVWEYVSDRVQKTAAAAGNKQTPVLLAERMESGFPLTINPARASGATLAVLKDLYSKGKINVDEMSEAESLFTTRGSNEQLRQLFRDLASNVLTPSYFRRLRQLQGRPEAAETQTAPQIQLSSAVQNLDAEASEYSSSEELQAFQMAKAMNTVQGWEVFLRQFGNGFMAVNARNELSRLQSQTSDNSAETLAFEMARASNTESAWDYYLARFPTGLHVAEARSALMTLKKQAKLERGATDGYILAESRNTEESWENFIKLYPGSALAVIAQGRLDTLRASNRALENKLYSAAVASNSADDWAAYVDRFPAGRFIEEAIRRRNAAALDAQDELAFSRASSTGTVDGWKVYLNDFPNGKHAAEASLQMDRLHWLVFSDVASIRGGSVVMGDREGEGDEKPPHKVSVDAFHIGRSEVTNAQYLRFVQDTGYRRPQSPDFAKNYLASQPDLPVVNVSHTDALAYCSWLSEKLGRKVRLPTEAEWEYAARSGRDSYRYPWGRQKGTPKSLARYNGNDPSGVKTVNRDAFRANDFGLFNMAGNVAEWVADFYSEDYYKKSASSNPTGPRTGKEKVVRGGSWRSGDDRLRTSRRQKQNAHKGADDIGFRIVIE